MISYVRSHLSCPRRGKNSRFVATSRWCLVFQKLFAIGVCAAHVSSIAMAQHPVDVQRLSAEGDHFRALTVYELLPARRMVADTHIAAAKSAWALGLTRQAAGIFDAVLRGDSLTIDDRARITLSRGIIEYQEEHFQEAALFSERAASYMAETAPLRGRALLLWGQSLLKLMAYASAEEKLIRALADAAAADRPEVNFALGAAQMKLGKLSDAEKAFKAIPADHSRAAEAVRALATISLQTEQHNRAQFWIEKGRSSYPDAFLDSWAEYGLTQVALKKGDMVTARAVAEQAQKKFPSSDEWLILMEGALEQAEWNIATKEQK